MSYQKDEVEKMLLGLRQEMHKQDKYFEYTIEDSQIVIHENAFYQKRWPSYTLTKEQIVSWLNFRLSDFKKVTTN